MGLRIKIFIILSIFIGVFEFTIFKVLSENIRSDFDKIETQKVLEGTERVHDAINQLVQNFEVKITDWAHWDDTYQFAQDLNLAYQESNLQIGSLLTLGINFVFYIDANHQVVFSKMIDLEKKQFISISDGVLAVAKPGEILNPFTQSQNAISGIVVIDEEVYVVASMQILKSDLSGPSVGKLIWGYKIDQKIQQKIENVTHYEFQLKPNPAKILEPNIFDVLKKGPLIEPLSEQTIRSTSFIFDIRQQPAVLLQLILPRPILVQANAAVQSMHFLLSSTFIFLMGILFLLLERYLFQRFLTIEATLKDLIVDPKKETRLPDHGNDEVAQLARAMNATLDAKRQAENEQQLAIEKLKMSNQELANTQAQLMQSQKLESLGKLAGGIAHDFNNILAGVMGYASLLHEKFKDKDPNTAKKIGIILKSAERGAELTKKMLGFARKGQYEKKIIDLGSIIQEAINLLMSSIDKSIILQTKLASDLWSIEGDSTQMLQVFMNLGVNARDAMPFGGGLCFEASNVDVTTTNLVSYPNLKVGKYVRVSVTDTGEGIPKEIQDKIFDPFFTTKSVGKGSGLGLSMVYGIIQNHGGTISVCSVPGHGTCFEIFFSAKLDGVLLSKEENIPSVLANFKDQNLKGKFVLIADDEEIVRNYLGDVIESLEMRALFACDGNEALQVLESHNKLKVDPIELILLDIRMPHKDGIATCNEIIKKYPHVNLIFISGYSEDQQIAALRTNREIGFIQKPFEKENLINQIKLMLHQSESNAKNKS